MGTQTVTLESLRRLAELKPPIVGIPRPGQRPFAFERRILAQLIEGLDGDTRVFLQDGELTPRLLIESASARRNYKLIGRDMTYYGSNNGAGSLQRNWAQSERARITGTRTVRSRYGNGTVRVPAKAKPSKRVPAFMYRDLREAEKHLFSPPKAERKELFAWLHPGSPETSHYEFADGEFRELTEPERAMQLQKETQEKRDLVLEFYRNRPKRQAVGQAVAGYFAKVGWLYDFNGLRKRLKELGFTVKPWSCQPVAIKRGSHLAPDSPWHPRYSQNTEAQIQFVKAIGYHLRLRKPNTLLPWLRAGERFESPVIRHNDTWKHCREARERVEQLRADIKALEVGGVVNFKSQQHEEVKPDV